MPHKMSYTSYFVVSQKITAKDIYDRETQRRSASDGPFDLAILTKIWFCWHSPWPFDSYICISEINVANENEYLMRIRQKNVNDHQRKVEYRFQCKFVSYFWNVFFISRLSIFFPQYFEISTMVLCNGEGSFLNS